jgi:hypothetical protein
MAYEAKKGRSALEEFQGSGLVEEPVHVHPQDAPLSDDRGPSSWLLTSEEQQERDQLLDLIRSGSSLSPAQRQRLAQLCSKKGLGDDADESKAVYITKDDQSIFLPR